MRKAETKITDHPQKGNLEITPQADAIRGLPED